MKTLKHFSRLLKLATITTAILLFICPFINSIPVWVCFLPLILVIISWIVTIFMIGLMFFLFEKFDLWKAYEAYSEDKELEKNLKKTAIDADENKK